MQLFMCFLLILSLATMMETASVRARRENVLSFITDAMEKARTTERIPADITGNKNPPSKPMVDDDSEDLSDAKSAEDFDTNGFKGAVKDLDSHEAMIPAAVEKDKAPPRRATASDPVGVGLMGTSSTVVPDSDEEMMLGAHLPGRQSSHLPGGQKTGADLQRKAGSEPNGSLVYGGSRELLDGDSLEHNNGRLVPQGDRNTDYDETREYSGMETSPLVRPGHRPSSSFVPAMN